MKKKTKPAAPSVATAAPYVPTPADFVISIAVLEKRCFGSAGCNVTYRPQVSYTALRSPDPLVTWRVVYEVRGGEQPQIGSFTLRGGTVTSRAEEHISTLSADSELVAVVTAVLRD